MTRRTIEAYFSALEFVNQNLFGLKGAGIIIDFENAMRAALKKISPDLRVYGCLFHFMQALTRQMQSMNALYELIRTNVDAKILFRKIQSLALLPANLIKGEFISLLREALDVHKFSAFAPFLDYFKNQWLSRVKPAHFSVFKLNDRTTGPAEAFNGKLNKSFRTHGSFFNFVEQLQKEESMKSDEYSRDITGIVQPDRRKEFYKKRSELILKYSTQLERKIITPKHFVCIMANVNNEILYDEKIFFTDDIDIKLSNEVVLVEGDDVPYDTSTLDCDDIIENVDKVVEDRPQRSRRKRKLAETAATDAPMQTRSKRARLQTTEANKEPAPEITTDAPMRTRSKRAIAQSTTNPKRTTTSANQTKTTQKKHCRPHEPDDDNSDSDVSSDFDSQIYEIMKNFSRNGSVMLNFRKRFHELEKQDTVSIDPDCFKCIICRERKKNTILFPCLHQHTCGPCWIMWKIQQINFIPLESNDEDVQPSCPVCKQSVHDFKEAKN